MPMRRVVQCIGMGRNCCRAQGRLFNVDINMLS